jgi:hypothetical protein
MQISASTLLASQQVAQVQAKPAAAAPAFAQALEKSSDFQPLSLKQTAAPAPSNFMQPAQKSPQRPGSTIDITV